MGNVEAFWKALEYDIKIKRMSRKTTTFYGYNRPEWEGSLKLQSEIPIV